ncbi:MAG: hypothetical protein ACFUZC_04475 [Chthoniobacteraceae bacterium]
MNAAPLLCQSKRHAFALIVVLSFIALLAGLLVAFFSRATNEQQIITSSNAQSQVIHLGRGAIDLLKSNLKQEIAAGSIIDTQAGISIYSPTSNHTIIPFIAYSTGSTTVPSNILKRSASGVSFFQNTTGGSDYDISTFPPSDLASVCSSTTASFNGRAITKERWNAPLLIDSSLTGSAASATGFLAPNWIIVTREGPKAFTSWTDQLKDASTVNTDFAIGRFAYVIYDEGGLLNINVAGNRLSSTINSRRGRLHHADLYQIPGLSKLDTASFLKWRAALTGTNVSAVPRQGGLFDPNRSFINVLHTSDGSDQTFINRRDLITYARQHTDQFGQDLSSLQYLGTFSRELNAPSFAPATPSGSSKTYPSTANPALAKVRFTTSGTLADGTTVTAGMPLLRKRFPLSRLAWVTAKGPSATLASTDSAYNADGTADNIKQYFGLEVSGTGTYRTWTYRPTGSTPASKILSLDEVAAVPRDPDFFELLKAVIIEGSIGQYFSSDKATNSGARDQNTNVHIMQIGANLIDQYDTDDLPTIISFTNTSITNHSDPEYATNNIRGVENLPYLHNLCFFPFRWEQGLNSNNSIRPYLYLFLVPRLWNPHQPLKAPDSSIKLRFVANGGTCVFTTGTRTSGSNVNLVNHTSAFTTANDQFTFTNDTAFTDPAMVNPTSLTATTSVAALFCNYTSPAVAATGSYPAIAQGTPLTCVALSLNSVNIPDPRLGASGTGAPPNLTEVGFSGTTAFEMQYSADGTTFYPYQHFAFAYMGTGLVRLDTYGAAYASSGTASGVSSVNVFPCIQATCALDPRTSRLGMTIIGGPTADASPWWGNQTASGVLSNPAYCLYSRPYGSLYTPSSKPVDGGDKDKFYPGYYSINSSNLSVYYLDQDSVLRRADGDNDHDVHPTYMADASNSAAFGNGVSGRDAPRVEDRPLVLNRPFRSVGEMGYAFRDVPWKSLNFFSSDSGDSGLLDAFSVDDNEIVAGRLNLNTRQPSVLQALLAGTLRSEYSDLISSNAALVDGSSLASQIATFITQWTASSSTGKGPLLNRGELATKIVTDSSFPIASNSDYIKTRREATIRALAESGQTRTWNLMLDVIAQSGRYPTSVSSSNKDPLSRFLVEGECRYWVHLAIDRYTGKIIDEVVEPVYE